MATEEKNKKLISVGDYIVIRRQDFKKLHKLKNNDIIRLGNNNVDLSNIINEEYFSTFKLEKRNKNNFYLVKVTKVKQFKLPENRQSGADNRNIHDDGKSQKLSSEDIVKLQERASSSSEIIREIVDNSTTFALKTEYSQEKYVKKKQKKYCEYLQIFKPTILNMWEIFFRQSPSKLMGIRNDDLSQILFYCNVNAFGNYLVYESGTSGLLVAAMLDRMGENTPAKLIHVHPGNEPQRQAITAMDFPKNVMDRYVNVNIYSLIRYYYQVYKVQREKRTFEEDEDSSINEPDLKKHVPDTEKSLDSKNMETSGNSSEQKDIEKSKSSLEKILDIIENRTTVYSGQGSKTKIIDSPTSKPDTKRHKSDPDESLDKIRATPGGGKDEESIENVNVIPRVQSNEENNLSSTSDAAGPSCTTNEETSDDVLKTEQSNEENAVQSNEENNLSSTSDAAGPSCSTNEETSGDVLKTEQSNEENSVQSNEENNLSSTSDAAGPSCSTNEETSGDVLKTEQSNENDFPSVPSIFDQIFKNKGAGKKKNRKRNKQKSESGNLPSTSADNSNNEDPTSEENTDASDKSKMYGGFEKKWQFDNHRACEILTENIDSLVIVAKEHPISILQTFLCFMNWSRPIVVFADNPQVLTQTYMYLKKSKQATYLRLTNSFFRNIQVLPERTHPAVNMTFGGYLLCGYRVGEK